MPNTYNIGDLVTLTATFTTVTGNVLTNPTSVVFTVSDPRGTQTTPTPVNTSVGVYSANVAVNRAGIWRWRATGTGAVQAQQDGLFVVAANTF